MANRSSDNDSGSCLNKLVIPIIVTLIAGGTAPWWLDKLFPPEAEVTQVPAETLEIEDTIFVEGIWEMTMPPETTVYLEFVQDGNNVSWDFLYLLEKGTGSIDSNELSITWVNILGGGNAKCELLSVDANHRATRIECDHGVTYVRLKRSPPFYQIAGTWSNIAANKTYSFISEDEYVFRWEIPEIKESGRGYIYSGGDKIYKVFSIGDFVGSTVCTITGKNQDGYLTRFECDNGAIVTR